MKGNIRMKIAFVTNSRAPYRTLQFNKFSEIPDTRFTIFYINKNVNGRAWRTEECKFEEKTISSNKLVKTLKDIVNQYDLIMIGGYDKKEYILLSLMCKLRNKKYILLFDGINPKRINSKEKLHKYIVKKFVISNSVFIFGNGMVSKMYFTQQFKYPDDRIVNQYLTVDIESISRLSDKKEEIKTMLQNKYVIPQNMNVVMYSGRLVKRKRIENIINALSLLKNKDDYYLLIVGDGEERENLFHLAKEKNINLIITGFIKEQEELFKFYYLADMFILPSENEPWGLVVNEAMAAGLPLIVSDECGSYMDLVKDDYNGFIVNCNDTKELSKKIEAIIKEDYNEFGRNSKKIIKDWTFENSKLSLQTIINYTF